jgi:hypothetical protein
MDVALRGNSPSTVTAGIMLLTRARQMGFPLQVRVVGHQHEIQRVPGPAVLYAPVLASCGVGREAGSGATVVLPGPPGAPVQVSLAPHGVGDWFLVDRTGNGSHPATQAYVRLSRDPRLGARRQSRELRRLMEALGMATEPALLDVLFAAPAPPLLRLAVALRAGRSLSGGRGESLTRYLAGDVSEAREPVPASWTPAELRAAWSNGDLRWIFDRLSTAVRDRVEDWLDDAFTLAAEDDDRDLVLIHALVEIVSHVAQLPVHSILPPLGAAEDSVAVGLSAALRAEGDGDANEQLVRMFRFLGGRFEGDGADALLVSDVPPPRVEGGDATTAVLQWFCQEVRVGRKRADALWDQLFPSAE